MAVEIELAPDKSKVVLTKREDGALVASFRFDPLSLKQQENTARSIGISVAQLLQHVEAMKLAGKPISFTSSAPPVDPTFFVVREFKQQDSEGDIRNKKAPEFITEDLGSVSTELLVTWASLDTCCCLDVDYHDVGVPDRSLLSSIVYTRMAPKPFAWHFSRGGGLHLFYVSSGNFTAEELASVAALRFRMIDPTAGVELKRQVRGPGVEPVVLSGTQDTTGTLLDWLREPDQKLEGLDEYLESEELEVGRRYPHEKCPLFPSEDLGKHRDPVIVRDSGVTCFVCEGKGRVFGSRKPGFFPWSAILGQPIAGDVGTMVRSLCHWGHAKWVLQERYGVTGVLAERAYSAALKAYHEDRPSAPLVPNVFNKTTLEYARVGSTWTRVSELKEYSKNILNVIKTFPATQYVAEDGAIKSDIARATNLMEDMDHTGVGYPPIQIIYGTKMAQEFLGGLDRTVVAIPNPELTTRHVGKHTMPRYVPFSSRMNVDKAWDILGEIYPGVDRRLVEVILCGVGSAQETELGLPPRIFVTGPSGAAKTAHFQIAAAIAGVKSGAPTVQGAGEERLRQAIMSTINTEGPIVVINEILKDAYRTNKKQTPIQALQPVLSLEKTSLTHVLYKGPAKFGRQFVLGLTEIALPIDIRDETQLARRIRYHRIDKGKLSWPETIAAAGISDIHKTRLASSEVAEACNSILSDVIDRFFVEARTFQSMADEIGIKTLLDSEDFADPTPFLRHFFKLVCSAPEIDNEHLKKMYSTGYKQINRSGDNETEEAQELVAIYTQFSNASSGGEWTESEKLLSKDWSYLLGVDEPVKLVMGNNGSSVFVRFQTGSLKRPGRINQALVDPKEWKTI